MGFGSIWKMTVKGQIEGNEQQNVLHYETVQEGATSDDDLAQLALIATEVLGPAYASITVDNWVLEEVQIRGITSPTQGLDVIVGQAGEKTSDPLPLQVAGVLSMKTGLIGRSYRGRLYLPTVGEGDNVAGIWSATYQLQAATFGAIIKEVTPVTPSTYQAALIVWSRTLLVATKVTALAMDRVAGTQRRRRSGVGS